jgi:hypothetical protein
MGTPSSKAPSPSSPPSDRPPLPAASLGLTCPRRGLRGENDKLSLQSNANRHLTKSIRPNECVCCRNWPKPGKHSPAPSRERGVGSNKHLLRRGPQAPGPPLLLQSSFASADAVRVDKESQIPVGERSLISAVTLLYPPWGTTALMSEAGG